MTDSTPLAKTCAKCRQELDRSQFHKHSSQKDGLASYCRGCRKGMRELVKPRKVNLRKKPKPPPVVECRTCHELKSSSEFGENKNAKYGINTRCLACVRAYVASRKPVKPVSLIKVTTKACKDCGIEKPLDDFYNNDGAGKKKVARCKPCHNAAQKRKRDTNPEFGKARWQKKKNDETYLAYMRDYLPKYAAENADELRVQRAEHYTLNRDRIREAQGIYSSSPENRARASERAMARYEKVKHDPEYKRAAAASRVKWEKENPHKVRQAAHRRRLARDSVVSLDYSADQLEARIAYFGGLCYICSSPWEAIDHVKPISKGGPDMLANYRPICRSCNSRKGNKWPYDFALAEQQAIEAQMHRAA